LREQLITYEYQSPIDVIFDAFTAWKKT